MAGFERLFSIADRNEFVAARLAKLRLIAGRGDGYFAARQHSHFLCAYTDCQCGSHSCSGCAITLAVAIGLEKDMEKLDPKRCDIEESKAAAIVSRLGVELSRELRKIEQGHEIIRAEREGRKANRKAYQGDDE